DEAHAVLLHQEADSVAVHAAAEAVVGLPGGADDEAGRLLAVERAQALVVDARLLERDGAAHQLDDVDAGEQVLDELAGDHGTSLGRERAGRGNETSAPGGARDGPGARA